MILDKQLQFSDSQALTATAVATNVIDLGAARDIFSGEPMCVIMNVEVAADFTSANETYAFGIETDDNASLSSPTVLSSVTLAASVLTLKSVHIIPIPVATMERYLGFRYTLGGTTPTVTVSAHLIPLSMASKYRFYADGLTIS